MKTKTHPKWYAESEVRCACGNTFTVGATVPEIVVEVCSACHPFYTGQMKFVDIAGRVDAFRARQKNASKKVLSKTERKELKKAKRINEELSRPGSLADLRKTSKKSSKKKSK